VGSSLRASNIFHTRVRREFSSVSEKKETKKREERFFSLQPPFPKESEKDDDASDKRRTRTILLFLSPFPSWCAARARARFFIYASSARLDSLFSIISKKREMHFFSKSRARKSRRERERERETIERVRETRTHTTHRKETTASMGPLRSPLKSPCLCVFVLFKCLLGPFCVALREGREKM